MEVIRDSLRDAGAPAVAGTVSADRLTLAKRRWRGMASDGLEFGFDLAAPLFDGALFASAAGRIYRIQQRAETVLEVKLIPRPAPVARLAWAIGNLHFPIQVAEDAIRMPEDPALRQLLEREGIPFVSRDVVFQPFARAHAHE